MQTLTYSTLAVTFGTVITLLIVEQFKSRPHKVANVAMAMPAIVAMVLGVVAKLF